VLPACGGDDVGADSKDVCLESLPEPCTPSIPVNYPSIYDKVLRPNCGAIGSGATCHGPMGNQGGLSLFDQDGAYSDLLGMGDGRARVLPGDAKCSVIMERLETTDTKKRMPLNSPQLPAGLRCAVHQWIEAGALEN
jgi:hypothetical protein